MNVLFLDDNKDRIYFVQKDHPNIIFAETVKECKEKLLSKEEWGLVCLDHDLGSGENGEDVVDFIIKNKIKIREIMIHSCNTFASQRMWKTLVDAGYQAFVSPFNPFMIGETIRIVMEDKNKEKGER